MREFHKRLVCDACEGMMLEVDDFESACADLIGEAKVELYDREPAAPDKQGRKPTCPRCSGELATARMRVAGKKMKERYAVCDKDGIWFPRDFLPAVFSILTRRFVQSTSYDAAGGHTRRQYQGTSSHDASEGLTIARWRNRPRKRAQTLTPVNAYRDQDLLCPVCRTKLVFMGDRYGCDGCRGLFVERAALEALVADMTDQPWSLPAATGAPGARPCPVCRELMTAEILDGESVDRCAPHGIWFDRPELEKVLVAEDAAARPGGIAGWFRRLF
jgi:Zn-finger nucleic acid-binding protein